MFGACRIETMEILLTVQDVDVLPVESGPEQRVDGRPRLVGVADGPDHAIGRIRDEVPSVSAHCFHGHDPVQRFVDSTAPWICSTFWPRVVLDERGQPGIARVGAAVASATNGSRFGTTPSESPRVSSYAR